MRTIKEYLSYSAQELHAGGIDQAAFEARLLLEFVTNLTTDKLLLSSNQVLTDSQVNAYKESLQRRLLFEPIAYITGRKEFYGLEFIVNEYVLIPRPDSEALVDTALRFCRQRNYLNILELGSGSGCLLLSVLHNLSPEIQGTAVDISAEALAITKKNHFKLGIKNQVQFLQQDWATGLDDKYDLIISNPPYITSHDIDELQKDVKDFEPRFALDGGDDGLDCYRKIARQIPVLLQPGGIILFEIGIGQAEQVTEILANCKLEVVEQVADLAGVIRCLVIQNITDLSRKI